MGVARVEGSGTNYQGFNINGGVNPESGNRWPNNGDEGKSYGMISIGGDLYMWVTGGKWSNIFDQVRLYRSTNKGRSWNGASWNFTDADGLSIPTILNLGRDNAGARDNYVYHYFIETQNTNTWAIHRPGRIHLLRVPQGEIFNSKSSYEYFSGPRQIRPGRQTAQTKYRCLKTLTAWAGIYQSATMPACRDTFSLPSIPSLPPDTWACLTRQNHGAPGRRLSMSMGTGKTLGARLTGSSLPNG